MGRTAENDRIQVSSVLYNLAGPESGRVDFLKSLVIGAVQKEAPIAESLVAGLMKGPGVRYRNFANWAKNNTEFTDMFGTTSGTLEIIPSIDKATLKPEIPVTGAETVDSIESAEIHEGRIHYWVLQYMYENYPDPDSQRIPKPAPFTGHYTYSLNTGTNLVTIIWPNPAFPLLEYDPDNPDSFVTETFTATDFDSDPAARFLYVKFTPSLPADESAVTWDAPITLADGDPDPTFPSPWLKVLDDTSSVFTADLDIQDVLDTTFSDARTPRHYDYPPIVATRSASNRYVHYVQDAYMGLDGDGAEYSIRSHKEFTVTWEVDSDIETSSQDVLLDDGVTRTDLITRTFEYLKKVRTTRLGTQTITHRTLMPPRWFIYRQGEGNATLNTMMADEIEDAFDMSFFYPPIPFRVENKPIASIKKGSPEWRIHLGYDWHGPDFENGIDLQVALTEDSGNDNKLASLLFKSNDGGGWFYAESRMVDSLPLYAIFDNATAAKPGVFRVRTRADPDDPWGTPGPWQPILDVPTPSSTGVEPDMVDKYNIAKKAFKKATGSEFDKVLDTLHDNMNLRNIDYAYAVFGVSLNTQENACKKYIYQFLLHLLEVGGAEELDTFKDLYWQAHASQLAWKEWWEATHDAAGHPLPPEEASDDGVHVPMDPPVEPTKIDFPPIRWHSLQVESVHEGISNYKTSLSWNFIDEDQDDGVLTKPDASPAKAGDLWFEAETNPFPIIEEPYEVGSVSIRTPWDYSIVLNNRVTLKWQETATSWRKLTIVGLSHLNNIYKDHYVSHTALECINWTRHEYSVDEDGNPVTTITADEQDAPFLIPMHEEVYREMSLADATQMGNACTYLVFNCFQETEEKWYETTAFKVILLIVVIIAAVAIAVFTGGLGMGAAGSLVGEALVFYGASVTVGIIVGTLVNIAVGYALSLLITYLATLLFGEKYGAIIGGIASFLIGGFLASGFDLDAMTKLFTTADGWISLIPALGAASRQYMEIQAQDTINETAKLMQETNAELARIQKLYEQDFKKSRIDPAAVNQYINEALEKPEIFLARTLMVGSDIVKATLSQIDDFVDDRLQLPLP
jgi:hypothetical protein